MDERKKLWSCLSWHGSSLDSEEAKAAAEESHGLFLARLCYLVWFFLRDAESFHRQSTVLDDAGRVALGLEKDPANLNVKKMGSKICAG